MTSRKTSIMKRILWPILLVFLVQAGIFFGSIQVSGVISELQKNAFGTLTEKSSSRSSDLQNLMVQRWSNVGETLNRVLASTETVLDAAGKTPADITADGELTRKLLEKYSSSMVYLLRRNAVSGAFIVLDGSAADRDADSRLRKPGLYFRDADPSTGPTDNSDLLAERAPSYITQNTNIAMDSLWMPYFTFDEPAGGATAAAFPGDSSQAFYFKPLLAARENPGADFSDLGYWSRPFYLNGTNGRDARDAMKIITYSVPLQYRDGTVFGVLGVEISLEYLNKSLPSGEVQTGNKGGYLLAVREASEDPAQFACAPITQSGSMLGNLLGDSPVFTFEKSEKFENIYHAQAGGKEQAAATVHPLKLYNSHTPFEADQWVLVGVANQQELLRFSRSVQRLIAVALLASLVLGIIGIEIVAKLITRPIAALVRKLRNSDPSQPIHLEAVRIAEIDELSDAVQSLSQEVADASSRLSGIIEMAGIAIGAFEYDKETRKVYWTGQLFEVLMQDPPPEAVLSADEFERRTEGLKDCCEEVSEDGSLCIFRLEKSGNPRWVRLKALEAGDRYIGVFTDITQEMVEKKKIEYDRDYDILTNLYNRRAFHERMKALFAQPEKLRVSALMMMDLDNLKYINDTYGHDYGDSYIRRAADMLRDNAGDQAVVSRLSGDEFVVFFHGFADKEGIRRVLEGIRQAMKTAIIRLPDQSCVPVRASAGVSWYPDDSRQYDVLIRYADFAMYMVKRTNKGQFNEFDRERYVREAHLLQCKEELNDLLENERVSFQFQPIVDARTGALFGVEALIRPHTENIKTPYELLSLARSQSKLGEVERLTWFKALEGFSRLPLANTGCRIFVNSIANQVLSADELQRLEETYARLLPRLVMELTEDDRPDDRFTAIKREFVRRWNGALALDDYGTGYNGESILVDLSPDFVKLDIAIVRNIHADNNRLQVLRNLVSYSRERGIRVIADGVECQEEMEVLIENGVDYLQGFYLGRPADQPGPLPEDIVGSIRAAAARRTEP